MSFSLEEDIHSTQFHMQPDLHVTKKLMHVRNEQQQQQATMVVNRAASQYYYSTEQESPPPLSLFLLLFNFSRAEFSSVSITYDEFASISVSPPQSAGKGDGVIRHVSTW